MANDPAADDLAIPNTEHLWPVGEGYANRIVLSAERVVATRGAMCERQLTVQFVCDRLEERDAVIAALRPLVVQGWRVDALYSLGDQAQRHHMILGERMDVFEAA